MPRPRRSNISLRSRNAIRHRNMRRQSSVEDQERRRELSRINMARFRASQTPEQREAARRTAKTVMRQLRTNRNQTQKRLLLWEKFEEIRLQKSAQVDSADYVHPADLNGISSLTSQDTNGFEHLVGAGTDYECSTSKRIKLEEDNGTNDQAAREAGEELYSLISSWSELLAFKLQTFDKTISERLMRQIDQLVFDTEMRVAKETSMEVSKSLVPETNQNSSRRFLSVDTQPGTVFATSSEHQLGAFETESHAIEIKTEIEEESSCDRNEIGYEYEEVEVKPEFLYMVPESTGDQLNKQSSSVFVAEDIKNEVVEEPGSGDKAVATENNQHLEILHTQHELNEDRFGERLASESHTKEIKIEPV